MQDQQANLDFAYAAIGRVADVAKRIIAQHYGKPPDKSYFSGCSTGGREAMLMTQRYALQFDGVIAGAPAMRTEHVRDRRSLGRRHAQRDCAKELPRVSRSRVTRCPRATRSL
jgi:alpha-beta hydrolase superfamily lysophospholipase